MFLVTITLQLQWTLYPPGAVRWFYTKLDWCPRCGGEIYARRSLILELHLPYATLHITTPAWWRWGRHNCPKEKRYSDF